MSTPSRQMMTSERIDRLLVQRGFAESRERAAALVMAGLVLVDERRIDKPGTKVAPDAPVRLKGSHNPYVSRGGLKLKGALESFAINVEGRVCLDVGASTGGFTDCLLQHGARRVYALDVGRGLLAWKIAGDPRVVAIERTNARTWDGAELTERPDLLVIDASFISLRLLLPNLVALVPCAEVLALVKPQFEVGRERVGKGGVVRDEALRQSAVDEVLAAAKTLGYRCLGQVDSAVAGPKGNREIFVRLAPVAAEDAPSP